MYYKARARIRSWVAYHKTSWLNCYDLFSKYIFIELVVVIPQHL